MSFKPPAPTTMIAHARRTAPRPAIEITKIATTARAIRTAPVVTMTVVRIAIVPTIAVTRPAVRKVAVPKHVARKDADQKAIVPRRAIALKVGVRKALRRVRILAPSLGVMTSAAVRRRWNVNSAVAVRISHRLLVTIVAVRRTSAATCQAAPSSIASRVRVVPTSVVRRTVRIFMARSSAIPIASGCVPSAAGRTMIVARKAHLRSSVLKAVGPVALKAGALRVVVPKRADPSNVVQKVVVLKAPVPKGLVQREEAPKRAGPSNVARKAAAQKVLRTRRTMPVRAPMALGLNSVALKVADRKACVPKVVAQTPVVQKVAALMALAPKLAGLKVAAQNRVGPKHVVQSPGALKRAAPRGAVLMLAVPKIVVPKGLRRVTAKAAAAMEIVPTPNVPMARDQMVADPRVVVPSAGQKIGPIANQIVRVINWNRFELRYSCRWFNGSEDFIIG